MVLEQRYERITVKNPKIKLHSRVRVIDLGTFTQWENLGPRNVDQALQVGECEATHQQRIWWHGVWGHFSNDCTQSRLSHRAGGHVETEKPIGNPAERKISFKQTTEMLYVNTASLSWQWSNREDRLCERSIVSQGMLRKRSLVCLWEIRSISPGTLPESLHSPGQPVKSSWASLMCYLS